MQHKIEQGIRLFYTTGNIRRAGTAIACLLLVGICGVLAAAPGRHTEPLSTPTAEWRDADLGATPNGAPPHAAVTNGRYLVWGGGEDIMTTPTAPMHFYYQPIQGDFELSARLTAKDNMDRVESRAGIMIRQSLEPGAPYMFLYFAKQHVEGLRRDVKGVTRFSFSHVEGKKPPIWLKLTRWHRTITAYYSEDGSNWTTMNREAPIEMPESALIGLAVSHGEKTGVTTADFNHVYAGSLRLPYKTSWIGNSFGGGDRWVQDHIAAMYVGPDGTCYTQAEWDEGFGNSSMYRDGDKVGALEGSGSSQSGTAITGDGKIVYLGTVRAGTQLPAVRRFHLDGTHASFPGGAGDGSFIMAPPKSNISSLAIGNGRLYVADQPNGHIYAYDPVTGAALRDWSCEAPYTLAVDKSGNVWVNQRVQGRPLVRCFSPDGVDTGRKIEGLANPGALAIDNRGRLLMAENGPEQQVRIYDDLTSTPRLIDAFGTKGGVYSGVPGEVAAHKLPPNIVGLGVDRADNLYIGSDGWSWGGVDIRKYTPAGAMVWRVLSLDGVVNFGDIDPVTHTDFYTERKHFTLDLNKPQGQEWSYQGYTLDKFAFPDDPRLHVDAQSTTVRYLKDRQGNRHRFLFTTNNWGSYLLVYRFDPSRYGEIAIPCMMLADGLSRTSGAASTLVAWPAMQPKTDEKHPDWIWRDSRGDGGIQPADMSLRTSEGRGWDIDPNGDLWQAGKNIHYSKYLGLDAHGVPEYAPPQQIATPSPFTDLSRIKYLPETDTLYLSGHTKEHPNHPYNGFPYVGSEVARYDHWHSGNPMPVWRLVVPRDPIKAAEVTEALDIAGDYVFAMENFIARIHIYDAKTSKEVAILLPGPEVAGISGWADMPYSLHVFHRSNGEYLIFAEEDYQNKVLMYRWFPHNASMASAAKPTK